MCIRDRPSPPLHALLRFLRVLSCCVCLLCSLRVFLSVSASPRQIASLDVQAPPEPGYQTSPVIIRLNPSILLQKVHMTRNKTLLPLLLVFAFTALSQTLPQGVRKITAVEGITEYAMPNGLHLLLFPDSSKPNVTVNMTYMVGSRHEGYGETGMAHLLEHMLFLQTKTRKDVKQELKDHGAEMNGSTDWDRTNYFETLNASDENLKFALELEADRMVNSKIEKPLLDTEMTVVRNEFEMGENSPDRMLMQRALETAYTWHNYGKSTIGNRSDIENVPIGRLAAFYQKYYQPDNALLTIAGKFDETRTLAQVAALFGAIPKPTRTLEKSYTVEPVSYTHLR